MRNRIFGLIGVLWGGGILLSSLFRSAPVANTAYAAGHALGLAFGALLFLVGGYYLVRGSAKQDD